MSAQPPLPVFTAERGVLRPQGAGCDVGAVERIPGGELVPVAFLPIVRR
jgi:hypothetical protein